MIVAIDNIFTLFLGALAARVAWSLGNTIVAVAARQWDKWIATVVCPRCGTKFRGYHQGKDHWDTVHAAEVEAEKVVHDEMTRNVLGSIFRFPRAGE